MLTAVKHAIGAERSVGSTHSQDNGPPYRGSGCLGERSRHAAGYQGVRHQGRPRAPSRRVVPEERSGRDTWTLPGVDLGPGMLPARFLRPGPLNSRSTTGIEAMISLFLDPSASCVLLRVCFMPPRPNHESEPSFLAAVMWLMEYLEEAPRLVQEVRKVAAEKQISPALLRRAAQALPIVRRPRELRGPWTWRLPGLDELVRVSYSCPVANCKKVAEGWMEFRISRILFSAGLVRYLTRGTARRTQRPEAESTFLRLEESRQSFDET